MEKTYKVSILRTRHILGHIQERFEHTEMTSREIHEERMKASRWIAENFHWEEFPEKYTHLVYCVRIGETYYIWPCGYLLDDRTFYENVAAHQGEGQTFDRVWAYHKS